MYALPALFKPTSKKPSPPRFFGLPAVLIALSVWTTAAQAETHEPITVEVAIAAAIERPELSQVIASSIAVEEVAGQRASIWPNPVFNYQREEVTAGDHKESEETFVLSQSIEISGRRGLRRDAAQARGQASKLDGEAMRRKTALETRRRFWRVVLLQAKHRVTHEWLKRLEEADKRVKVREAAGEGSTYDVLRVEREARASRAALARIGVEREVAWLTLLELTGPLAAGDSWPRATGGLLPQPIGAAGAENIARPDVKAWLARERAATLELSASKRAWVPEIGLTAGMKRTDGHGPPGEGFTAGVGLALPLFDHGQGEAALARARAARARSMTALLSDNARRQRRPAMTRARELTKLAVRLRSETESAARKLEATAEAAWRGGELEVLEILDVHRGQRDDALSVLDLEHAAREAREDLREIMLEESP